VNTKVQVAPDLNTELTLDKVHDDKSLAAAVKEAKFMEEIVEIEIAPDTNENAQPMVVLNVNGINQPVWRGYPTPVRRKFVEVLARMKETRYSQRPTDFINPETSNAMIPRTGQAYPFQVLKDPNPKGYAWLRQILAEAG
jgi:hypothetical protein